MEHTLALLPAENWEILGIAIYSADTGLLEHFYISSNPC